LEGEQDTEREVADEQVSNEAAEGCGEWSSLAGHWRAKSAARRTIYFSDHFEAFLNASHLAEVVHQRLHESD